MDIENVGHVYGTDFYMWLLFACRQWMFIKTNYVGTIVFLSGKIARVTSPIMWISLYSSRSLYMAVDLLIWQEISGIVYLCINIKEAILK